MHFLGEDNGWHGFTYDNGDLLQLSSPGAWQGKSIGVPTGDDANNPIEGNHNGAYIALWSHHYNLPDSPQWPKAIKIRFTLRRQVKGETNADHEYEVICHLSQ